MKKVAFILLLILCSVFSLQSGQVQVYGQGIENIQWEKEIQFSTENLNNIIYGNNTYVAIGENNLIRTSIDGINWTQRFIETDKTIEYAACINDQFYFFTKDEYVLTSKDLTSWTTSKLEFSNKTKRVTSNYYYSRVEWMKDRFIRYTVHSFPNFKRVTEFFTSVDGIHWDKISSIERAIWGIAYNNNNAYVAVATGDGKPGTIYNSSDAVTWTKRDLEGESGLLTDVTWAGNEFVVVGNKWHNSVPYATILTSKDGVEWTEKTSITNNYFKGVRLKCVTSNSNMTIAMGYEDFKTIEILTSTDGATWVRRSVPANSPARKVRWVGIRFIAVGNQGDLISSADGQVWEHPTQNQVYSFSDVTWDGNEFIAMTYSGEVLKSIDGHKWIKSDINSKEQLEDIAYNGHKYVSPGREDHFRTSDDGINWVDHKFEFDEYLIKDVIMNSIIWNGKQFIGVGYREPYTGITDSLVFKSIDGVEWEFLEAGTNVRLQDVHWNGYRYVAVGYDGVIITSTDGVAWTKEITHSSSALKSVAWNGEIYVVVGNNGALVIGRVFN